MKYTLLFTLALAPFILLGQDYTTGLVAYYPFSGNANDASGNGNNGTVGGGVTLTADRFGAANSAYNFPGNADITVPDAPSLRPGSVTLACWINCNSSPNTDIHLLVAKPYGSSYYDSYQIWFDYGNLMCGTTDGSTIATLSYPYSPTLGTWHHLVFAFDDASDIQKLYVDGTQVASGANHLTTVFDNHPLKIGSDITSDNSNYFFDGKIDQVRVYNRMLTPADVTALYAAENSAPSQQYTWNGIAGNWSDATKWTPNGVPGANDNVTISSDGTCTLLSATTVNNLSLSGSCTLTGNFNMTVGGTLTLNDCTFSGTGTVTVAGATINTGGATLPNRSLVMNGGGSSTGFSYIFSPQITIPSGQTFTKTTTSNINWFSGSSNTEGVLIVQGTLVKNGPFSWGLGSYKVSCNGGAIQVNQGGLSFGISGTPNGLNAFNNATITLATGTTLNTDGDNFTFNNSSITGDGTLHFSASQTIGTGNTISSRLKIASGVVLNQNITPSFLTMQNGGSLTGTANVTVTNDLVESGGDLGLDGNVTVGGNLNWSGGIISGTGTATINGAANFSATTFLITRTLLLNGGAAFSGSEIRFFNGATLRNAVGSTFTFSPAGTANLVVQSGSGTFQNDGTIVKSGAGSSNIGSAFVNNGLIKGSGTLTCTGAFTQNAAGVIAPGTSPGILNMGNNLHLGSGTLQIEVLNASGPGTGHDQLTLSGNVTLSNASLTVMELGSCTPNGNYNFLTWTGTRTGTFASTNLPAAWTVQYDDVLKKAILVVNRIEVCDGLDNDCDGAVDEGVQLTFYADADNDGYGNAAVSTQACSQPAGYVSNNTDCNDNCAACNPGATETCDGLDNDCDGQTDEGVQLTWYADTDGDGYGNAASTTLACMAPGGYVSNSTDCDDSNAAIHPGVTELCNGIDDDCDGQTDEGVMTTFYADTDNDGYGSINSGTTTGCTAPSGYVANHDDCNDSNPNIHPGATEVCNGLDDDCNGMIDDGLPTYTYYLDADGDGYGNPNIFITTCFGVPAPAHVTAYGNGPYGGGGGSGGSGEYFDSDDVNPAVNPGMLEVCNGIDDDSDGLIDEDLLLTFYTDSDGDNYGDPDGPTVQACAAPAGFADNNTDCDDANAAINPGTPEICNGLDDNCNWLVDEGLIATFYTDADGDTYGDPDGPTTQACSTPPGFSANNGDCDDSNPAIHPNSPEVCNGLDDNCDGLIDNTLVFVVYYTDVDGDGDGDPTLYVSTCDGAPVGYVLNDDDCNDENSSVYPGAAEICDGLDNDCDGLIDDADPDIVGQPTWYADADGDGYGNAVVTQNACNQPSGYVGNSNDCNDSNGNIYPGATEICDGLDNDCDGLIDETTLQLSLVSGNISCHGGATTLTATATGGAPPFQYSLDGGPFGTSNTFAVSSGSHEVTVEDAHNCQKTSAYFVEQPAAISINPVVVTHVFCTGGNTGAIDITVSGGTGNHTYHWSNNKVTQDLTALAANTYTVTVTDANACTATVSATVNPRLALTVSKTNTICNGGSDGTATANPASGTPDYTYLWNTGATTQTIENLSPGTYTVTVTDALGCSRVKAVSVGQPSAINVSGTVQNVTCNGAANGNINISHTNGTAPFTYEWNDGATTMDRSNIGPGAYTVTVTDVNGCTRTKSFNVSQPTALTVSLSLQNVTCNGAANGTITATGAGGTRFPTSNLCNNERYCYTWSNGASTKALTGLAPGTYTVVVTDLNGCTVSASATITQPEVLEITDVIVAPLNNGKYALIVIAAGGTLPYKYRRTIGSSGYQGSNLFNNVPAGTYEITVRDARLCETTLTVAVPGSARPSGESPLIGVADDRAPTDGMPTLLVYPNPANEEINVLTTGTVPEGSIFEVWDYTGRVVQRLDLQVMSGGLTRLDLMHLLPGAYLIRWVSEGKVLTVNRFIVVKD